MIEGLSRRANVRLRHIEAPLLKEREQYLEHLCARGIGRMGIRVTAAFLIHVIRVMELSSLRIVTMEEINEAGQSWAAYVGPERRSDYLGSPNTFVRVARHWLTFHSSLVLPPSPPYSEQIEQFSEALRSVQGLAPATVRGYSTKASFFLRWLDSSGGKLESVQSSDVDEFLAIGRASSQSAAFIAAQCQALRSFSGTPRSGAGVLQISPLVFAAREFRHTKDRPEAPLGLTCESSSAPQEDRLQENFVPTPFFFFSRSTAYAAAKLYNCD